MSDQVPSETTASEAGPAPKGGKGKLLVIAVIAVALVGGGIFAFSMFSGGEKETSETAGTAEPADSPPQPDVTYVEIERLPAAVTDSDGRTMGYVFLDISLELQGDEDRSFVSERLPRIQDAILRSISRDGISRPDEPGVIDFEGVSQRFKDAANSTLGREVVQRVLIPRALRSP